MMSTMTATRTASPELQAELQLNLAAGHDPDSHGVAAITVDNATGEILVVCVCALLGAGPDVDVARADLADAHAALTTGRPSGRVASTVWGQG